MPAVTRGINKITKDKAVRSNMASTLRPLNKNLLQQHHLKELPEPVIGQIEGKPVSTQTVQKNRDAIAKLSQVELSQEQQFLKDKILKFCRTNLQNFQKDNKPSLFIIQGDAGTGKSVILNALFNDIQAISKRASNGAQSTPDDPIVNTKNYLLVNHPEMLKLYHRISRQFPYINKSDLERPTSLINKLHRDNKQADIILIDEAHLLLSKKNAYKKFYQDNHLEELLKLGKVVIIIYDDKQSLRFDSYWTQNTLEKFTNRLSRCETYYLKQQFRVTAGKDLQEWIQAISVQKKVLPRPTIDAERRAAGDKDAYDFRIYSDAGDLYRDLMKRNDQVGGARLLATYDWPYRLPKKGEGGASQKQWYVTCGKFKLPWDKYLPQVPEPWSEQPDSYKYVGSVYTIQGFDLTYAGVILGPSVGYDELTDEIIVRPENYEDHAAYMGRKKDDAEVVQDKEKIVLNSVNVLLTRGVKGLYLYAHDSKLRQKLLSC